MIFSFFLACSDNSSAEDSNDSEAEQDSEKQKDSKQDDLTDATIDSKSGGVSIVSASGWLNSAYIIFNQYSGAKKYTVKISGMKILRALLFLKLSLIQN